MYGREVFCEVCYDLLLVSCFTGDVSDVEEGDKSGHTGSPCTLGAVVPDGVIKPVAVRVSGRRCAVEKIEDLLQEEQMQPLDLSLKRPKMT